MRVEGITPFGRKTSIKTKVVREVLERWGEGIDGQKTISTHTN